MTITATDFFLKYRNKFLDVDGVYGNQCVDVIKAYFREVLGRDPILGNAIDYWKDIPGFVRVPNTLTNFPKVGDIVVWSTAVNPVGHIGICNWWSMLEMNSFEQNYPIGSPCHYRTHSYKNVLGWLRPVTVPVVEPAEPFIYDILYLSDTNDISGSVATADAKLKALSGGMFGLKSTFRKIPAVYAPSGQALSQGAVWPIIDSNGPSAQSRGMVLGYRGDVSQAWYHTATSASNFLYSSGQRTWYWEQLVFEIKHQLVNFYNKHRGSRPFIELIDNYTYSDAIVKAQLDQLKPHLQVFHDHPTY